MSNLFIIKGSDQLLHIFDNTQDKLISIMFFAKGNPLCRTARQHFERSASNNTISIFCIIDTDNYEGDKKIMNGLVNLPHIDFYYMSNKIGTYTGSDQKAIEDSVQQGQRYVMTQANIKNQPQQQAQYIAPPQNQQYYQQPVAYPPVMQTPVQPNNILGLEIPNLQQMQQYFQIFQMLNQMGALNMSAQTQTMGSTKSDDEQILSNGDKLVPLGDGKYGLIKKT